LREVALTLGAPMEEMKMKECEELGKNEDFSEGREFGSVWVRGK